MKDRIQLNGVWYVKEGKPPRKDLDPMYSQSYSVETDKYMYEAVSLSDKPELDHLIVTNKTNNKSHTWDNITFIKGISEELTESLNLVKEDIDDTEDIIQFTKFLKEKKWL